MCDFTLFYGIFHNNYMLKIYIFHIQFTNFVNESEIAQKSLLRPSTNRATTNKYINLIPKKK